MHILSGRILVVLILMLLGPAGVVLAAPTVSVQAPAQIAPQQAFPVQVSVSDSAGSPDGETATLTLIADQGLVLGGTVRAPVLNGTAVFPAVVITGSPTGTESIRLAVVVVAGTQSMSGVSTAIQVNPPTFPDATPGGIGVDLVMQNGQVIVFKPADGMPAAVAGVLPGDQIVRIDGKSTDGITDEALGSELGGAVGTQVVLTVRHKGSSQLQDIPIVRVAMVHCSMRFNAVQNQMNEGAFQISVYVEDGNGKPLPDAHVTVRLNPSYNKVHAMFFTSSVVFKDGSGTPVDEVSGVTGPDGTATMWVRLGSNTTPFKVVLTATVDWHQQTLGTVDSNVFNVYLPSE